ncbi:hypothetical protein GHT06_005556 [Daphnia sinensis]|uniref:RNA-directed DNA polymerase n=1 Tax=Daphnia sinensis TaxID=1820382 RepID=A0AAD5KWL0_9CRUS|nr:hypothetical protein GHT06_005556 [Daphnia sinensis]
MLSVLKRRNRCFPTSKRAIGHTKEAMHFINTGDARANFFSCLDLASGYWQVPVAPEDQEKTAFITPDGLYSFVRLPFGLNCAPASFQRVMDKVLAGLKWNMCLVYLDDILIFGKTFDEHLARLDMVLKALERANLTLNVDKCIFGASVVSHLGHVINAEGIHPESEKVRALTEMPVKNLKSLRAFLGLAMLCGIGRINKKRQRKKSSVTVQTDASQIGLGAVLSQDSGNGQRPVAFISRKLTDTETRYHANELECLAVVWALKKLRSYIYGRHFTIKTDSSAVKWMVSKKEVKGKFLRSIMELQEFTFDIEHVKGVENQVADALSRNPDESRSGTSDSGTKDALVAVMVPQKPVATHELALLQQQDGKLRPIFTSLQSVAPSKIFQGFVVRGKVLYKINSNSGKKFLLVVPPILRRQVLEACHDTPSSGHQGEEKTLFRIKSRFWWPRLGKSVENFVNSCIFCLKHKHSVGLPVGKLQPIEPPSSPFQLIGVDHLGPFKETPSGHRHVIVCIDYLSKWVEMAPVPDTSTKFITPFELVNGRQPVLPVERLFPWPAEEQESHVDFLSRVHKLREAARLRILKKQRAFELLPGDLVLVRRPPRKKGLTKKFLPKFTGPFQVVKKVSATTFLVEDLPAVRKKNSFRRFHAHPMLSRVITLLLTLSCVYTSSFYRQISVIQTYRLDTSIRKAYSVQSTLAIFRNRMPFCLRSFSPLVMRPEHKVCSFLFLLSV